MTWLYIIGGIFFIGLALGIVFVLVFADIASNTGKHDERHESGS